MEIIYVSLVTEDGIYIENINENLLKVFENFKIQKDHIKKSRWIIQYHNEIEQAKIFEMLRDKGIAFSTDKGWGPAEQFEDLRDKGLIKGKFKFIGWWGPDKYKITEK